jgi:hypothetical protein
MAMKKVKVFVMAATTMLVAGCGMPGTTAGTAGNAGSGSVLGGILGDVLNGGTLGNVITSVIGAQKVTTENLIGTWRYSGPGCAFTSDQLLAKAGGEVAAAQIKTKLQPYYQQIGISSSNTYVTFNQDGTYTASFDGKPMQGKWTFDEATYKVTMQGLLLTLNCYAKRNVNGIGLLFEGKKLLTMLQTLAALSGNANLQAIGEVSKSYDGVRIGFDFTK